MVSLGRLGKNKLRIRRGLTKDESQTDGLHVWISDRVDVVAWCEAKFVATDSQFISPNFGRSLTPIRIPASAAAIHSQPCRLVEATPEKNAPMLQPKAMRAP